MDYSLLKERIDLCRGYKCFKAKLLPPFNSQWGLETQLDNGRDVYWNPTPWVVEDFPELHWQGDYFFHRVGNIVYFVEGTSKDFSGSIYRPRLGAFRKMVRWALPNAEVGFTVKSTISEHWGYMLCSPWLIKSTKNLWYNRLRMFEALNSYNPELWPMSLMLEHWKNLKKIGF